MYFMGPVRIPWSKLHIFRLSHLRIYENISTPFHNISVANIVWIVKNSGLVIIW